MRNLENELGFLVFWWAAEKKINAPLADLDELVDRLKAFTIETYGPPF